MKQLKEAIIKEETKRCNDRLKKIKTEEGFKHLLGFEGKTYKGTKEQQRKKFSKYLLNKKNKAVSDQLNQIDQIEQAKDFNGELIITVEWKKSYMWGYNPRAYTNYGFKSDSIGGCGYCKLSTATAEALNSHLPLLKLMYEKKNKAIPTRKKAYVEQNGQLQEGEQPFNFSLFGYGSGYGILPHFEGGVGVSSHQTICENLGLKMDSVTSTDNVNVYRIYKNDKH